jgi:saccharopine dehydrogenase-like NADP-dependent oxidoreductase
MSSMNIVCFGFGQVAKSFIKKMNEDRIAFKLTTTSREKTKKKNLKILITTVFNLLRQVMMKISYQDLRRRITFFFQ